MEVNAACFEGRQISAMDNLLPSLFQRGLLSDIECRIIICAGQLTEKQLALCRIMVTKNKETAAKLIEVFRKMTCDLHGEEKLQLQKSDCKKRKTQFKSPLQANKNPMRNDTVIRCVFGFLPLCDIKNCRMVSRQWNSTAEILLRKRAKIHFRNDGLRPDTFLAASKLSLPDLPFTAFKFSDKNTDLSWCKTELEDFFHKWGKNIKELNLSHINIAYMDDPWNLRLLIEYDITPWLKNAPKITSLTIEGNKELLNMSVSAAKLEFLSAIKTFILKGNSIETCSQKDTIRMAPVNIELSNITCKRDDEILTEFHYNDSFDFSQAATIRLDNCQKNITEATFDMKDQVFKNTELLWLKEITINNWEIATGSVRHVQLEGIPFIEKNHLKIQSLQISGSEIDFFALPQTIERIEVKYCEIFCSQQLILPKLKYLKLHWSTDMSPQLSPFRLENCENLKELDLELDLWSENVEETSLTIMFDVRSLPKNLQALRIKGNLQKYLADDWILEIPGIVVLDAEYYGCRFSDYARIAEKFHAGTLVLVCREYMKVMTDEIFKFLLPNMKGEPKRVIIGVKDEEYDLHSQTPFEGSLFSTIVDAKSNYYEFENVFGKAITRDQFLNGCISVGE